VFRRHRTRKATALALLGLLLGAVMPWASAAQTGDYSGSASGTVAEVQLPGPGGGPTVHSAFAESTGAVNSEAQIIPDVPATEADESQDFAVGTASPVRAEFGGQRHNPGSVQSSAPDSAAGSADVFGPDPDSAFSTGHAETSSEAAPDASTANTDNTTSITNGRFIFHLPLQMPNGSSEATVDRAANGEVTATGQAQLGSGPGQRISAFGGYVTAAAIEALSSSTADGTSSANVVDFRIQDLRLGVPGGSAFVTANAQAGPGGSMLLDVTIAVPGSPPVTQTITIPRGSNLLSAATYTGTTLAPAFGALTPYLSPLTGPTGPLHDLQIILAAGFSDDGDGTYARGLVEAVQMSIVVGTAFVAHTFGRAYSAVDAERAFSTATDPTLPPGTTPTSDAAAAFPETRAASPTEHAFASDNRPGLPVSGGPAQPAQPGPVAAPAPADQRVPEASDEPAAQPQADEAAPPADGPVVVAATQTADTLPFTGLDVAAIAALGLLLMALGGFGRWATRQPTAAAHALPAQP
jgi:hypothetical protein